MAEISAAVEVRWAPCLKGAPSLTYVVLGAQSAALASTSGAGASKRPLPQRQLQAHSDAGGGSACEALYALRGSQQGAVKASRPRPRQSAAAGMGKAASYARWDWRSEKPSVSVSRGKRAQRLRSPTQAGRVKVDAKIMPGLTHLSAERPPGRERTGPNHQLLIRRARISWPPGPRCLLAEKAAEDSSVVRNKWAFTYRAGRSSLEVVV